MTTTDNAAAKRPTPFDDLATPASTSLTTTQPDSIVNLRDLAQVWRFAEIVARTDLVPKQYRGQPEAVLVAIEWGAELGLPPMQAMQNIAVINGNPSIWGPLGRAIVLRQPDLLTFDEGVGGSGDHLTAWCEIARRLPSGAEVRRRMAFSWQDAKRANLAGRDTYRQYPDVMLAWRAFWRCARAVYADALRGIAAAEEERDREQVKPAQAIVRDAEPAQKPAKATDRLKASLAPAAQQEASHAAEESPRPDPTRGDSSTGTTSRETPAADQSTGDATDAVDDDVLDLAVSNALERLVGTQPPGAAAELDDVKAAARWFDSECSWLFGKPWSELSSQSKAEVHGYLDKGVRIANAGLPNKQAMGREVARLATDLELTTADLAELATAVDVSYSQGHPSALPKPELERLLDAVRAEWLLRSGGGK